MSTREKIMSMIDELIQKDKLKPAVNDNLDSLRHPAKGDTFYTLKLKKDGLQAAEEDLASYARSQHWEEFAAVMKPIALAIRDLTEADTEGEFVHLTNDCGELHYRVTRYTGSDGYLISALIPPWKGCGCNQPEGAALLGFMGSIPLRAVTLAVSKQLKTIVGLVFGFPGQGKEQGFTVIEIDRTGDINNMHQRPVFFQDGYLKFALGIVPMSEMVGTSSSSDGHLDGALGFPASFRYLAEHIHLVAPFLRGMAEHIKKHRGD